MNPIPGYHIEAELGRGRFSTVYRAVQVQAHRKVALKVVPSLHLVRMGQRADFGSEFDALAALAHSRVIPAHDHGLHDGRAYLALEVAAGPAFEGASGALDPSRVHAILRDVAQALASIHAQGWVHRDLKPANLLRCADGTLVLGDLGSACRQAERGTLPAGFVIGTPKYAAPEQGQGAVAQPSADVYSLGILLHELLTGRAPYPGETLTELFSQHQMAPVPRLPQALAYWQPLLDAMLAKAPGDRLSDGLAVLHELSRLPKGLS
ncbi:MAG: serine/threonine protein kinase [Ramlibacter sp.]|nr:serine/threonine protein kinase [Ramlibacter sp.]